MKKYLSIMLTVTLCMTMAISFAGCGKEEEGAYSAYDLSEYIVLADYDSYELEAAVPEEVTELEMEKGIQKDLSDYGIVYERSRDVVAAKGDVIKISYEGTLADGTTKEGMSGEEYSFTLGEGKMIPGFEEGLYGVKAGETVTIDVTFPTPYTQDTELSGKDATFKVTVLTVREVQLPELTDELIREAHDGYYKTVEEYKADVKRYYEELHEQEALDAAKDALFAKIIEETEVIKYPEEKIDAESSYYIMKNMEYASNNQYDWETYRNENLQMTEEEFEEAAIAYAEEVVKREMIVYAMAEKEGLDVTEKEYQDGMDNFLTNTAQMTAEEFEEYMGMTIEEYAEEYKLEREMLMEEAVDIIYNRAVKS